MGGVRRPTGWALKRQVDDCGHQPHLSITLIMVDDTLMTRPHCYHNRDRGGKAYQKCFHQCFSAVSCESVGRDLHLF